MQYRELEEKGNADARETMHMAFWTASNFLLYLVHQWAHDRVTSANAGLYRIGHISHFVGATTGFVLGLIIFRQSRPNIIDMKPTDEEQPSACANIASCIHYTLLKLQQWGGTVLYPLVIARLLTMQAAPKFALPDVEADVEQ